MMSTKHPLISIITPTWNREFFLQKLANSLMAQTVKNFEWIVGNDGSTDLTEEFIKSFAKKADFKIIYVNSSLRIGKAALDNILLEHVSGEYLSWCGSDDTLRPDAIEFLSNLVSTIPENEKNDYVGIYAQNIDSFGKSQTFNKNNKLEKTLHVKWEYVKDTIKGDGTILERSEILKDKKFLEVDFLISESSYFNDLYRGKKFIFTPKIVKTMDRSAENSISFGKKLLYCRGSAYCISKVETQTNFEKHSFFKKLKIIINYWRYTFHGDIDFWKAKNMLIPTRNNFMYMLLYPLSIIICIRDNLLNKVEKTHIEFEKNIKRKKIKIELLN
tara:strand:- start:526 stop:1515 length:990 start_codon:yes stop_codon:yes gene_type:complete